MTGPSIGLKIITPTQLVPIGKVTPKIWGQSFESSSDYPEEKAIQFF
jgi:hypothetical protein